MIKLTDQQFSLLSKFVEQEIIPNGAGAGDVILSIKQFVNISEENQTKIIKILEVYVQSYEPYNYNKNTDAVSFFLRLISRLNDSQIELFSFCLNWLKRIGLLFTSEIDGVLKEINGLPVEKKTTKNS